jgi:hypothetical protein
MKEFLAPMVLQSPIIRSGPLMNNQTVLFMVSLFGIVPAVLLLYYILATYDEYFKDSTLYVFFAGGMTVGLVAFVLQVLIIYNNANFVNYIDIAILIFVLAFAAFEELIKFVILYLKWFQGDHATTYYGVAFGLGFGATPIIGIMYRDVYMYPSNVLNNPFIIPTYLCLSLGYVGLNATTGGLIGYGSSKGIRWKMIMYALALHIFFNFILLSFWWSWYPVRFGDAVILAMVGMLGVYQLRRDYITRSLPKHLARKRRRELKSALHRAHTGRDRRGRKRPQVPGITFGEKPAAKNKEEE